MGGVKTLPCLSGFHFSFPSSFALQVWMTPQHPVPTTPCQSSPRGLHGPLQPNKTGQLQQPLPAVSDRGLGTTRSVTSRAVGRPSAWVASCRQGLWMQLLRKSLDLGLTMWMEVSMLWCRSSGWPSQHDADMHAKWSLVQTPVQQQAHCECQDANCHKVY